MAPRVPNIKFLSRLRDQKKRSLTFRLTQAVWNTPDCARYEHVSIKNPLHTSHTDPRPHITVLMQTEDQRRRNIGQTVHIYYDPKTDDYEAFRLFSERELKPEDIPKE